MIKSMKDGSKVSARAYAKELIAGAVTAIRGMGCQDVEMTDRERLLVVEQLNKITDRLLAKLVK